MINYWIMAYIILMHFLDMFFTYKMIKIEKKKLENAEIYELNFHRKFMEKFGLEKGVIISFLFFSLPAIILLTTFPMFFYPESHLDIFIAGIITTMAYVNYMSVLSVDELKQKLIQTEEHKRLLEEVIKRKRL